MVSASFLIGLSAFSARALAGAKTGIFNSIDHISAPKDYLPETPSWSATVGWSISKEMNVKEGDTFALHMPYVYKFTSGTRSLELVAGDTSFAKCELFSGDNVVDFCELQCTALAAVEKVSSVKGTVEFPFTFNAGMLGDSVNLAASTIWKAGKNTVTWADGENEFSCDVEFTGESSYVFSGSIEHGAYFLRKAVLLNTNQHYVLGPQCHADGMSGYIQIENPDSGVELDCRSVAGSISDQINDFFFPQSAEKCSVNVDECSATKAKLSFSGIPAGFRPFLNVNAAIPKKDFSSTNSYSYKFSCGGFILEDHHTTSWYMYKNGETGGDGDYNDIVVTTVTGSHGCPTAVNTVTGPSTNTIVVTVPPSETTDAHETGGFHKTESDCDDGFDHTTEGWGHETDHWGHETDHWDHETDHWGHKTENWETEDCLTESDFDHKTEWDHKTEDWGHKTEWDKTESWGFETDCSDDWGHKTKTWGHKTESWETDHHDTESWEIDTDCSTDFDHKSWETGITKSWETENTESWGHETESWDIDTDCSTDDHKTESWNTDHKTESWETDCTDSETHKTESWGTETRCSCGPNKTHSETDHHKTESWETDCSTWESETSTKKTVSWPTETGNTGVTTDSESCDTGVPTTWVPPAETTNSIVTGSESSESYQYGNSSSTKWSSGFVTKSTYSHGTTESEATDSKGTTQTEGTTKTESTSKTWGSTETDFTHSEGTTKTDFTKSEATTETEGTTETGFTHSEGTKTDSTHSEGTTHTGSSHSEETTNQVPSITVPQPDCSTITTTWTGTVTSTTTECVSGTTTVVVQVPPSPVTTVTKTTVGIVTFTTTEPCESGTQTVVVGIPSGHSESETSTEVSHETTETGETTEHPAPSETEASETHSETTEYPHTSEHQETTENQTTDNDTTENHETEQSKTSDHPETVPSEHGNSETPETSLPSDTPGASETPEFPIESDHHDTGITSVSVGTVAGTTSTGVTEGPSETAPAGESSPAPVSGSPSENVPEASETPVKGSSGFPHNGASETTPGETQEHYHSSAPETTLVVQRTRTLTLGSSSIEETYETSITTAIQDSVSQSSSHLTSVAAKETSSENPVAFSSAAPSSPAVSTYDGSAASHSMSLFALVLPLIHFLV